MLPKLFQWKLKLTCKYIWMREVKNNKLHYHFGVTDGYQPSNHAPPVMANKNTFAVPCNWEMNAGIIAKKQVGASLPHIKSGCFANSSFYSPTWFMHFAQILSVVFPKPACLFFLIFKWFLFFSLELVYTKPVCMNHPGQFFRKFEMPRVHSRPRDSESLSEIYIKKKIWN